MPHWALAADSTYAEVRTWLQSVDPELDRACDEVDRSLLDDTLRLTLRERLDRSSATARWLGEFTARARVVRR